MMLEFVTLAVGPKHCDLEVKDLWMKHSLGRVQFDINVQQVETLELTLEEVLLKLQGKEERPLFCQFKVITSKNMPKISE
jgi:hypothetical protein